MHHLEPMWDASYRQFGNTCFAELCEEFVEHIEINDYDRVILVQFEDWKPQELHYLYGLGQLVTDSYNYAYGWTSEEAESCAEDNSNNVEFCEGGRHSDVVMIAEWMHELKGQDIYISGAFDGECIDDLETALDFLELPYTRIEELII